MIDSKQFINTRHKNQKINYDNVLKELIKEWKKYTCICSSIG